MKQITLGRFKQILVEIRNFLFFALNKLKRFTNTDSNANIAINIQLVIL